MTENMQQLRPGTLSILRDSGMTDFDEWDIDAHAETFEVSDELQAMFDTLNEESWWLMSVKTSGATPSMVTAVEQGRGLAAYRNVHSLCQAMNQTSVHELRC